MINLLNSVPNKILWKIERFSFLFLFLFFPSLVCFSQTTGGKATVAQSAVKQAAKASPAYAEILVLKTELEAQLEDFAGDYTEDFPKIKEIRFQLDLIKRDVSKILAVNPSEAGKLSSALGKLIVRRVELETELWNLQKQYKDDFPSVKKAKRKVDVFDRAIREILP